MSDSFSCVHHRHHLLLSPSMNSEHCQATHEQTFSVIHSTDRQQNFVSSASRGRFVMTVVALAWWRASITAFLTWHDVLGHRDASLNMMSVSTLVSCFVKCAKIKPPPFTHSPPPSKAHLSVQRPSFTRFSAESKWNASHVKETHFLLLHVFIYLLSLLYNLLLHWKITKCRYKTGADEGLAAGRNCGEWDRPLRFSTCGRNAVYSRICKSFIVSWIFMNDRSYKDAKTIKSSYLSGCTFIASIARQMLYIHCTLYYHVHTEKYWAAVEVAVQDVYLTDSQLLHYLSEPDSSFIVSEVPRPRSCSRC